MIYNRVIILSIATTLSAAYSIREAHGGRPPRSGHLALASCRPVDSFGQDFANRWIKRTVSDTSDYAVQYRAEASLPQTSPDSVSLVTNEALCAVLQAKFARAATHRDTLGPYPVLAVLIAPSKYVVTDVKAEGIPFQRTATGFIAPDQTIEVVTMTVTLDSVRLWRYPLNNRLATPY
ncbi:MAG TPA: hypothetical protein VHE78_13960 [Gemmatimonadaceae bacterium]|nr:hypothetical protein [Gemmatimonadaceae bacterium]